MRENLRSKKTTILEQKNLVIDTVANDEDEKTKIIKTQLLVVVLINF